MYYFDIYFKNNQKYYKVHYSYKYYYTNYLSD